MKSARSAVTLVLIMMFAFAAVARMRTTAHSSPQPARMGVASGSPDALHGVGLDPLPSETRKTDREQGIYRNQYGAVVRDSSGTRINYTREELEAQESAARENQISVESTVSEAASVIPSAAWAYAAFGTSIGGSNINISLNGGVPEIYLGGAGSTFGGNSYWYALRYNSTNQGYDQVYVSQFFSAGIRRIKVADVVGDSSREILVALGNGQIILYDQATRSPLQTLNTAAVDVYGFEIADTDGDGVNELILCTSNHLYVYSGLGALKWDLPGVGGYDVVVAQMDTDNPLEIALTDGHIVDSATHTVQWTWPYGFGSRLAAANIDNDSMQELIVGDYGFLWAYDVERQLPKWSIPEYVQALLVNDIDNDGHPDALIGQGQWGAITAYDLVTQQQKWSIPNPDYGVSNIAVADVDGDGATELLWGAGGGSSGPDYLYVVNWQTKQTKWKNVHLDGPFLGPEIGDLDGDGRDELVTVSWESDSGYGSGRILVFDAVTRNLRAISSPIVGNLAWTGTHDFKLRDVDGDGRLEVLVAADRLYDGVIEIYGFDSANTFTMKWTNSTRPNNAAFYSVDAADVDGDGQVEIVGGVGPAQGNYVYVYGYNSGDEKWHSLHIGWGATTGLGLADVNQDGTKEIVAMVNGLDVYIFDGPSKTLEAILFGPFSAMSVQNVDGLPTIVLSNSAGELQMYRYSSGSYRQTYTKKLVSPAIPAFTLDSRDRAWIATGDSYYGSDGILTEVTLDASVLATYSGYGFSFGRHVSFVPASLLFFTAGSYCVVAFPTCGASLSSNSLSVSASGGTGSVDVTADETCDWGAASNATWITITSGATGTANGTVTYAAMSNPAPSLRIGTMTIAGQSFTVFQGAAFLDVAPGHLFYDYIGKLSAHGVTLGCGGGNYCPEAPVTREQMAIFIVRALGVPNPPTPSSQRFADVGPNWIGYAFIEELARRGITQGCGDGMYCPDAHVTREQMAAFLIRALGEFNPPFPLNQRFDDVGPTNPFYAFIDRLAALQITLGCSTNPPMYCPADDVSRAQMAAFLVRAFAL